MEPEFERSPRRERGEPQEGERWAPGVSSVFRISPGGEIILEKSLGFVC